MATVFIPASLRKLTAGRDRVVVSGHTLGQVLDELERQFPGIRAQLVDSGDIRPSVAVSIDGEVGTEGLRERVAENSEIHFLPALGGGA